MRIQLDDGQIDVIKKALTAGGKDDKGVLAYIEEQVAEHGDPDRQKYIDAAHDKHHVDGEIEVDDDAQVSMGGEPGAYVQAWIWVDAEDAGVKAEKAGG